MTAISAAIPGPQRDRIQRVNGRGVGVRSTARALTGRFYVELEREFGLVSSAAMSVMRTLCTVTGPRSENARHNGAFFRKLFFERPFILEFGRPEGRGPSGCPLGLHLYFSLMRFEPTSRMMTP